MEYKHLTVGDLHLYDREMRTTNKMVENSRVILEELYRTITEDESIILLNINGDIQHKTPNNVYNRGEVAYWRQMFRKIGQVMQERFKKIEGYSVVGLSEQGKEQLKRGEIYPIFTTRGNHDNDKEGIHTFYDDLLEEGLILNAKGLLVKVNNQRTYFSYRNYGTTQRKIPEFKTPTQVIALEHDSIIHAESMLWRVPKAEEKFILAEDVVKDVDVTLLSHIHGKVDPIFIGDNKENVLWQFGAMGRTSFEDETKIDVGYGALMRFGDVKNFGTIEFNLIPYKEYFSYKKILKQKNKEEEFKDFALKVEEHVIEAFSYEEDINRIEGIEDSVKAYAIAVMKEVESRGA